MNQKGWMAATLGAVVLVGLPATSSAEEATQDVPDPTVVADREASAADPLLVETDPAPVADGPVVGDATRMADLYHLDANSTSGGYIRVAARDNPAQDSPGYATTTMRIYGNAAGFRDGTGEVSLRSQFTCSGAGISGLSIGSGGASVSGGISSSTLTWTSSRSSSTEVRQYYAEGGHFRCKASNASPAKTTRRATATASYKNADTRAQDEYSFWW